MNGWLRDEIRFAENERDRAANAENERDRAANDLDRVYWAGYLRALQRVMDHVSTKRTQPTAVHDRKDTVMTPETAELVCDKARAAFARSDGAHVDDAELVDFKDHRYGGKYVLLRRGGEVVAIYKTVVRMGPDRAVRRDGDIAFEDNSISVGVKRIKRAPKGLIK